MPQVHDEHENYYFSAYCNPGGDDVGHSTGHGLPPQALAPQLTVSCRLGPADDCTCCQARSLIQLSFSDVGYTKV
jgi:hypothetical protein